MTADTVTFGPGGSCCASAAIPRPKQEDSNGSSHRVGSWVSVLVWVALICRADGRSCAGTCLIGPGVYAPLPAGTPRSLGLTRRRTVLAGEFAEEASDFSASAARLLDDVSAGWQRILAWKHDVFANRYASSRVS